MNRRTFLKRVGQAAVGVLGLPLVAIAKPEPEAFLMPEWWDEEAYQRGIAIYRPYPRIYNLGK